MTPDSKITYEPWPKREGSGGQVVGTGPCGVRGIVADEFGTVIAEACCHIHRSQHKNKRAVEEMLQWAMST